MARRGITRTFEYGQDGQLLRSPGVDGSTLEHKPAPATGELDSEGKGIIPEESSKEVEDNGNSGLN